MEDGGRDCKECSKCGHITAPVPFLPSNVQRAMHLRAPRCALGELLGTASSGLARWESSACGAGAEPDRASPARPRPVLCRAPEIAAAAGCQQRPKSQHRRPAGQVPPASQERYCLQPASVLWDFLQGCLGIKITLSSSYMNSQRR